MGVVADDITGANDIGIMFARAGYETHVYTIGADSRFSFDPRGAAQPAICILDTNSRLDAPEVAYRKVFDATRLLVDAGVRQFHNKTCSVFRGNIGVEFDAMLDALGQEFALVVLGFPKNGRTTVGGIHYVHGQRLEDSPFRDDPIHPMTQSSLVDILQSQTRRKVGLLDYALVAQGADMLRRAIEAGRAEYNYLIVDVADQGALKIIARAAADLPVLCGSSAIAEELPVAWGNAPGARSGMALPPGVCGVLVAAGSLTPQTRAQVAHLREMGVAAFELSADILIPAEREGAIARLAEDLAGAIEASRDALFHSPNSPESVAATRQAGATAGLSPDEIARGVTDAIAEVVARVLARTGADRLIVAGGETSGAVCRALGIAGMRVWREIQPGLPSCVTLDAPQRWLVLKSGSFGSPDFLEQAIAHLKGLSAAF
jgi:uncharacterized protein YgbK (DUF1537 family)